MGIVLADYPDRPDESDHRPRPCRRQARVRGDDADEEDRRRRDRGGGARLGRVIGHEHPQHGALPWFWVSNLVVLPLGFYLGARLGGPRSRLQRHHDHSASGGQTRSVINSRFIGPRQWHLRALHQFSGFSTKPRPRGFTLISLASRSTGNTVPKDRCTCRYPWASVCCTYRSTAVTVVRVRPSSSTRTQ